MMKDSNNNYINGYHDNESNNTKVRLLILIVTKILILDDTNTVTILTNI